MSTKKDWNKLFSYLTKNNLSGELALYHQRPKYAGDCIRFVRDIL